MTESALVIDNPLLAFVEERLGGPLLERTLARPLREFLARPGKQVRARLVELSWALAGGRNALPPGLPLAVELLHAGSLIVDDIEDCAEERRGAPALHLITGLPVALNAGNWLYFAAMEQLVALPVNERRCLAVVRRASELLARCHEGQALDVGVRISTLPQREVEGVVSALTERKTGGLSALCTSLPALCAGAPRDLEEAVRTFGVQVGVGLQMLDDCGGISCERRRAKGEEDLRNGRATWAWSLLARKLPAASFRSLQRQAALVEKGAAPAGPLLEELRAALRDEGQQVATDHLAAALGALRVATGRTRALDDLAQMVRILEQSYG